MFKKLFMGLSLSIFIFSLVLAYSPTEKDLKTIKILKVFTKRMSEKKVKLLKVLIPMTLKNKDKNSKEYFLLSSLQKIIEKKPLNIKIDKDNTSTYTPNMYYSPTKKDLKSIKILRFLVKKMPEKKLKLLKAAIPIVLKNKDKNSKEYFLLSSLQKIIKEIIINNKPKFKIDNSYQMGKY